jgi:hypothetical protein
MAVMPGPVVEDLDAREVSEAKYGMDEVYLQLLSVVKERQYQIVLARGLKS